MSSLEKYLFRSLAHFLIGLFVILVLSCISCLYILEIVNCFLCYYFSHSKSYHFALIIVSFVVLLNLIRSHLFNFHYSVRLVIQDLAVIYFEECSAYVFL